MEKMQSISGFSQDEFLPPVSLWTSLGGVFLLGTVTLSLVVASLLKYNVTVKGSAVFRPLGELSLVEAQTEGIVKSIEVENNQVVNQGDIIARLDTSTWENQKIQLEKTIENRRLKLIQIESQLSLLETQILAESQALERLINVAQLELTRQQQELKTQEITALADLDEAQAALTLAQDEMNRYQQLVSSGAISQQQLQEKAAAVKAAAANLTRAKARQNPSATNVAIALEQISQETARGKATLANLYREKESLRQSYLEMQTQLLDNTTQLQETERELEKGLIRAPREGIVFQLNLRNSGQALENQEAIAKIAPIQADLIIKTAITTEDVSKVKVGQTAQIRVNGCPYTDFGTLQGEVTQISPDTITPQVGSNYFEVTIKPKTLILLKGNQSCQLVPGMDGEANIITQKETLLQFVLRKARISI